MRPETPVVTPYCHHSRDCITNIEPIRQIIMEQWPSGQGTGFSI